MPNQTKHMSLQNKLKNAAASAATHAVQTERARCLWLLDCMLQAVSEAVDEKLMSKSQRHYANAKLVMVKAVVGQVKRGIISGLRPPTPFSILRQPVNDVGEMQTRCSDLIDVLQRLGWEGESTVANVQEQIREWSRQEDLIDEMRDKIECMQDEIDA